MRNAGVQTFFATIVTILGLGLQLTTALRAEGVIVLPDATVNHGYTSSLPDLLNVKGVVGELQWEVAEEGLPNGVQSRLPNWLELKSDGTLQGTPSNSLAVFKFAVRVTDSRNEKDFVFWFSLQVHPELSIIPKAGVVSSGQSPALSVLPKERPSGSTARATAGVDVPREEKGQVRDKEGEGPSPATVTRENDFRSAIISLPVSIKSGRPVEDGLPAKPAASVSAARITTSARNSSNSPSDDNNNEEGFDPASFIRIYEHTSRGKRLELYNPGKSRDQRPRHLTADEDSIILIEPGPELMGEDLPLNKLYISAKLAKGNKSNTVVVVGYSEVGKARETAEAQRGMAFQTAQNIQNMMLNMAFTAKDIIHYVCELPELDGEVEFPDDCKKEKELYEGMREMTDGGQQPGGERRAVKRLQARFHLFKPEIDKIADFFLQDRNLGVVELLGTEVFWMDRESLQGVARQYKDNLGLAFGPASSLEAKKRALSELWERTKLVYKDFREVRLEIQQLLEVAAQGKTIYKNNYLEKGMKLTEKEELLLDLLAAEKEKENQLLLARSYAIEIYSRWWREEAFQETQKLIATGSVSLRNEGAKDGDMLTLTIEAQGAKAESIGIPAVFEIAVKQYGAKINTGSPSFFFVKRLGIDDSDVNPPTGSGVDPVREVNFAPAPGITFGLTFFKRGDSYWDRFVRGLAPGFGVNVSFMNFDDPSFDLASGRFTKTTGTNVQIGAGPTVGLFNNMVQFTYGWNLNADRKRRYFGVGFGFIEIANTVRKYVKK